MPVVSLAWCNAAVLAALCPGIVLSVVISGGQGPVDTSSIPPPSTAAARLGGLCRPSLSVQDADAPSYWLASLWDGFSYREDLATLRELGVRALQLQRCMVDPLQLEAFLDRAWTAGLRVVLELSRSLFLKPAAGCFFQGYDCYNAVRANYRRLLATALTQDGQYHPAVETVLLMRDPDLAAAAYCQGQGCSSNSSLLAVLSAWDGLLDAEQELGVQPGEVSLTSPWSTITLGGVGSNASSAASSSPPTCSRYRWTDGGCTSGNTLRSLWTGANEAPGWARNSAGNGTLRRGLLLPSNSSASTAYMPHNNLSASLADRWVHAFGANTSTDDVIETLRQYQEFVQLPPRKRGGMAALLQFLPR